MLQWAQQHSRLVMAAAVLLVIVGLGVWFMISAGQRRERFAAGQLNQAKAAVDVGNLQLAASDLSRIVNDYASTLAGQEAAILLARVQLRQSQPDVAISQLRSLLARGPEDQFMAAAHGLLGGALEQAGQFTDAANAYADAANATRYELIKAQLLLDAGRAATLGGDTARATAFYQRVIDEITEDAGSVAAAQVRLAELQAAA